MSPCPACSEMLNGVLRVDPRQHLVLIDTVYSPPTPSGGRALLFREYVCPNCRLEWRLNLPGLNEEWVNVGADDEGE